jgi:hypothetical protein
VVHDPEHRPIAGAAVTLKAVDSAFTLRATTGSDGEFELPQAPIGVYRLEVTASGFATVTEALTVASGTNPVVHVALPVAAATQSVVVEGLDTSLSASDSVTPTTLVTRAEIEETPGASRTIGMEMITDYVPGAYMTHDMLHMRGGHQTSWLIDGVAIPNTKIASNVGPQIDPKDIDALETQRGSYAAEVGDRTYGVFNVLPRNGFERNREGELLLLGRQSTPAKRSFRWATTRPRRPGTRASPAPARITGWPRRSPHLSRCHELRERFRLADSQPDAQRSTAVERAVPAGLF